MRGRVVVALLALGLMGSGAGAVVATSGGSANGASSAVAQYHHPCKKGFHRHHGKCVPNKKHKHHKPKTHVKPAGHVGKHSAALRGTLKTSGLPTTFFFRFGPCSSFPQDAKKTGKQTTKHSGTVSVTVHGLRPNTKFCFQLLAKNGKGSSKSAIGHFRTKSQSKRGKGGFTG